MESKRIAVIAGDGIGKEVMPEGLRCLEAAARRYGPGRKVEVRVIISIATPRADLHHARA